MGGCFSDVKGGKEAIGGGVGAQQKTSVDASAATNDAVDFFYKTKGLQPLFTQLEVSIYICTYNFYVCIYIYMANLAYKTHRKP